MRPVGKPQTLRRMNMDAVEALLRARGPLTKPELRRLTGLSLVTVGKAVDELVSEGRALPAGPGEPTGGRTAQLYAFNRRKFCFLALYYYENRYACALADAAGEIFCREDMAIGSDPIVEETLRCIRTMRDKTEGVPLAAVGVGVPGVVSGGVITRIPSAPGLEGVALGAVLEQSLHCPVWVENDIGLAAWGLYTDCFARESDHLAYLYFGKGVGCGLVLNGNRFKGALDFAGEVGSLPMGGRTLEERFWDIRSRLAAGDETARDWLLALLATVVDNLACVLNPGVVAIKCDCLSPQELKSLSGSLTVPAEHQPRLVMLGDVRLQCLQGVLRLCTEKAGRPVRQ